MPIQAVYTISAKKRRMIIDTENLKNDTELRNSVFPFGHEGI
jgi:hypothetical protein